MIIQFERKQYKLGRFEYQISKENVLYGKISLEKGEHANIKAQSYFADTNFSLEFNTMFGPKMKEGIITKQSAGNFNLNGEQGTIYYCGKKGSNFLNGIYYWNLQFSGVNYDVYEVGFGKKGIYYCIWSDNHLCAIISKKLHTKHFESVYTVYSEESVLDRLLIMLNVYWDITRFYPSESSEEWHTQNTWQKELKNKYDSSFIPRIKMMHGISE